MSQESLEETFEYTSTGVAEACGCGASPYTSSCRPEPHYNGWGVFALLWGMSAKPRSVRFKCWKCNKLVFESRDPQLLEEHGKT